MSIEDMFRAAFGVALGCWAVYLVWQRLPKFKFPGVSVAASDDLHTVLAIASRLKTAGNTKAVALCEQLIHELLQGPGK